MYLPIWCMTVKPDTRFDNSLEGSEPDSLYGSEMARVTFRRLQEELITNELSSEYPDYYRMRLCPVVGDDIMANAYTVLPCFDGVRLDGYRIVREFSVLVEISQDGVLVAAPRLLREIARRVGILTGRTRPSQSQTSTTHVEMF